MGDESRPESASQAGGQSANLRPDPESLKTGDALLELARETVAWMKDAEETTGQRVHDAERELGMAGVELASLLANCKEGKRTDDAGARAHIMRARRIAVVAIVSHVSDEALALENNVGKAVLIRHFQGHEEFFRQISKGVSLAKESEKSEEARPALLRWFGKEWPGVKMLYQSLQAVEPVILAEKRKEDENDRRFYAMRKMAVVGVIAGIVGVIVGILGWLF